MNNKKEQTEVVEESNEAIKDEAEAGLDTPDLPDHCAAESENKQAADAPGFSSP